MKSLSIQMAIRGCALCVILTFTGCLMSEEDEYHVKLNADGKSGTITVISRNIQSDQSDPKKQEDDFDELIKRWKGDEYLLDKTKEEVYVKERRLWIEKGILMWQEVSIFAEFSRLFRNELVNDTLRLSFDKDQTVLATNGTMERGKEKTVVSWPPGTTEYTLRIKQNNFAPKSDFAAKFNHYTGKK